MWRRLGGCYRWIKLSSLGIICQGTQDQRRLDRYGYWKFWQLAQAQIYPAILPRGVQCFPEGTTQSHKFAHFGCNQLRGTSTFKNYKRSRGEWETPADRVVQAYLMRCRFYYWYWNFNYKIDTFNINYMA